MSDSLDAFKTDSAYKMFSYFQEETFDEWDDLIQLLEDIQQFG